MRRYSAKETYHFKEPTHRSHPMDVSQEDVSQEDCLSRNKTLSLPLYSTNTVSVSENKTLSERQCLLLSLEGLLLSLLGDLLGEISQEDSMGWRYD